MYILYVHVYVCARIPIIYGTWYIRRTIEARRKKIRCYSQLTCLEQLEKVFDRRKHLSYIRLKQAHLDRLECRFGELNQALEMRILVHS